MNWWDTVSRRLVLILVLLISLPLLAYVALLYVRVTPEETIPPSGDPVCNINTGLNYTTIQAAIDANETLDGHTIFVKKGIYYEHVVVNKSVSLIGENRTTTVIDGNGTGTDIRVTASSVVIEGFTVRNGTKGIYLYNANDSLVTENDVVLNGDAILVYYSSDSTVHQNIAGNNTGRGILVSNSWNFTVSNNYVYSSGMYGLNTNSSADGLIKQNSVYENNYDGIGLLDSSNCTVIENNASNNPLYGVMISSSDDSVIYHNNFINNSVQASDYNLTNKWDDGVEGNYWSDYTGVDPDHDGIGDTAYVISAVNQDNRPLMGMFHSFNTSMDYRVNVISNSTIEDFAFFESNSTLRRHVSSSSATQSFGFCRVRIPKALMSPPYEVVIDNGLTEVFFFNGAVYDDGVDRWIYLAYQHSTHGVDITPEAFTPG
jgi:parallel beta-helix repeat protein